MTTPLPNVEQTFTADVDPYVAQIRIAIQETNNLRDSVDEAIRQIGVLRTAMAGLEDRDVVVRIVRQGALPDIPDNVIRTVETIQTGGDGGAGLGAEAEAFRNVAAAANDARDAIEEGANQTAAAAEDNDLLAQAVQRATENLRNLISSTEAEGVQAGALSEAANESGDALNQLVDDLVAVRRAQSALGASTREITNIIREEGDLTQGALDNLTERVLNVVRAQQGATESAQAMATEFRNTAGASEENARMAQMFETVLGRLRGLIESNASDAVTIERISDAARAAAGTFTEFFGRTNDLNEAQRSLRETIGEVTQTIRTGGTLQADAMDNVIAHMTNVVEAEQNAREAADAMGEAFRNSLEGSISPLESFQTNVARMRADLAGVNLIGRAGWPLWIHWIIAGGSEILAVLIPALIALGSGAAVAAQGAQMMSQHLMALYNATEATANVFGKTMGQMLGMRSALQQAQNTANPEVWATLGAAIGIAKAHLADFAQMGAQLMQIIDTFAAKVRIDLTGAFGQQLHGLIANGVQDLVMFGQVFGNLGHALLNFASDMPGLAEVLLRFLDAVSRLILAISNLPKWIIMTFMAMEELYRWGGLAVTVIARLSGALIAFVGSGFGVVPLLTRIGQMVQVLVGILPRLASVLLDAISFALQRVAARAAAVTADLSDMAAGVADSIAGLAAWQIGLVAVAAAGLGFLIYKLSQAKGSIEIFMEASNSAVQKASNFNVINTIWKQLGDTQQHVVDTTKMYRNEMSLAGQATQTTGNSVSTVAAKYHLAVAALGWYGTQAQITAVAVEALNQHQRDLLNNLSTVNSSITYVAERWKTSYIGALALAQEANVKLVNGVGKVGSEAQLQAMKIADLVQGYQAMGQPANVVGKDMTALAIQSGLATTKVQSLNQAWDQFMQTIVGGTSGLSAFVQGLSQMSDATAATSSSLTGHFSSISTSGNKMAFDLQGFTAKSAQSWQQFNSIVGQTAPQIIDWFRTAGAMGAMGGQQFVSAVKDMVAQLIPFAAHNKTALAEVQALAQEVNGPATGSLKQLQQWAGVKGTQAAHDLAHAVEQVTQRLGNMSSDAQALGNVMQNDLIQSMDQAQIAAIGLNQKMKTWDQTLLSSNPNVQTIKQSTDSLRSSLQLTGTPLQDINNLINTMAVKDVAARINSLSYSQAVDILRNSTTLTNSQIQNTIDRLEGVKSGFFGATGAAKGYSNVLTSIPKNWQEHVSATGTWNVQGLPGSLSAHIHGAGAAAAGMLVTGGISGKDSVPIMAMPGEAVVPTHLVPHVAPLLKAHGVPGFAQGGIVPGYGGSLQNVWPWMTSNVTAFQHDIATDLASTVKNALNQAMAMPMGATGMSGNVAGWLRAAMGIDNVPANWFSPMMVLISKESGGNPKAYNPSGASGIGQMMPGTFNAWSLGGSIWNPIANLVASMRYIMANYGSPFNIPGLLGGNYKGYDQGGLLMPGLTMAFNATGKPETVLPPEGNIGVAPIHVHVSLDGKQIWTAVQQENLKYNVRNSGAQQSGVLAPSFGKTIFRKGNP